MSVEILTVSLSDESAEKLAQLVVAGLIKQGYNSTTDRNPPSSQNPQGAERSGFRQESRAPQDNDGWDEPQQRQQSQEDNDGPPTCACGDAKRWVPPGYSERSGKSYKGFWACPRPRGQQCGR